MPFYESDKRVAFRGIGKLLIGTALALWCWWQVPARRIGPAGRGACTGKLSL
jgi:hypothetical protein